MGTKVTAPPQTEVLQELVRFRYIVTLTTAANSRWLHSGRLFGHKNSPPQCIIVSLQDRKIWVELRITGEPDKGQERAARYLVVQVCAAR